MTAYDFLHRPAFGTGEGPRARAALTQYNKYRHPIFSWTTIYQCPAWASQGIIT